MILGHSRTPGRSSGLVGAGGVLPCLLVAIGLSLSACQQPKSRVSAGADGGVAGVAAASQPIAENLLEQHGLETIWTREVLDGPFHQAFVVGDHLLVVGLPGKQRDKVELIAYNRGDGLHHWIRELELTLPHPPTLFRYPASIEKPDELYIGQRDKVVCRDVDNGLVIWEARLDVPVSSGIRASETHIVVGSYNRNVVGYRKGRSIPDWQFITNGDVRAAGVLDELFVYLTSTDGRLYRFHAERGPRYPGFERNGFFATGDSLYGAPLVHAGRVYVGSTDYKLYCLRTADLSEQWSFQAQAPIEEAPLAADFRGRLGQQTVIFCISSAAGRASGQRTLWAIGTDGSRLWRHDDVGAVVGVGKATVYATEVSRSGHRLVGLAAETGEQRFALPLDGFDLFPSSVATPGNVPDQRAIIHLIHKHSGFIQAIGERF